MIQTRHLAWSGLELAPRTLQRFLAAATLAGASLAQITYSIDYVGPTIALPDGRLGVPITEADILVAPAQPPTVGPFTVRPGIFFNGGPGGVGLAWYPISVGHPPGVPGKIEVDALSYGSDGPVHQMMPPGSWWFSVDEFASGLAPAPVIPPNLTSEGVVGAREASADLYLSTFPLPPGPLPPFAAPPLHRLALDGNGFRGLTPFAAPGAALLEWNPPGPFPALGDDIDAFDLDLPPAFVPTIYFSLDSGFFDPLSLRFNTGSAAVHGFVGGDVLRTVPLIGVPGLYAPAVVLGLDRIGGPDSDDLDALILTENGIPGYQPSMAPYDWLGGQTDLLLFSVRRGSRVINAPDCFFGAPIQEGDILTPPVPGGLSPFPGIFIAAENIGLATRRSGAVFGDELDGLDVPTFPIFDCNANGQEDAVELFNGMVPDLNNNGIPDPCDVASGASYDFNFNGIPDEVEFGFVSTYCVAKVNSLGCTPMIGAFGTPSVTNPVAYWVSAVDVVAHRNGTLFYGGAPRATPFKGGTLCVNPPTRRTGISTSGGAPGIVNCSGVYRTDMNARIQSGIDPLLVVGSTVFAQYWSRDPGSSFNTGLTDAITFTISP